MFPSVFEDFCLFCAELLPWFVPAVARSFLQAISKDEAVAPPLRVVQIEGLVTSSYHSLILRPFVSF